MISAETGRIGEQAAAEFLRRIGFEICAQNWRTGHYELDIIARKDGILHFVEVKTRRTGGLTTPEMAITAQKFRALTKAASAYLSYYREQSEVQFDLAAVDIEPNGNTSVRLIENAMEYNW